MWEVFTSLSATQLAVLCFSAVLIGINKTAIPGIGILPVVLLSLTFEPRLSTGIQLLMLAWADIMAVAYYRRHADWKIVLRLLPWSVIGLGVGMVLLRLIPEGNDQAMRTLIGAIVLGLMVLKYVRKKISPDKIPSGLGMAAFFGILMGTTTQLANAAGPVSAIYLLAMRLPKDKYIGSGAWLFLIVNWLKVPGFVIEGRINLQTLMIDVWMIPLLLLGGFLGIKLLKNIPQKLFEQIIEVIVLITAIRLLLPASWF